VANNILLSDNHKATQDAELLQHLWDKGSTPIKIDCLQRYLSCYKNKTDASLLLSGFTEGFRLQYTGPRVPILASNLISTEVHKADTHLKLQKEVELGRMLGPFIKKPISTLGVSPIGLVPKKNGFRLITHLSYPDKLSVNHFIDPEICKVKYSSIDNVVDMISALGQKALCAKMDISQAFRLLIINPADFDLLGIMFGGKYYVDKCLPMGCSISCLLFEKFAIFVH